jgi:hypothetical protein
MLGPDGGRWRDDAPLGDRRRPHVARPQGSAYEVTPALVDVELTRIHRISEPTASASVIATRRFATKLPRARGYLRIEERELEAGGLNWFVPVDLQVAARLPPLLRHTRSAFPT